MIPSTACHRRPHSWPGISRRPERWLAEGTAPTTSGPKAGVPRNPRQRCLAAPARVEVVHGAEVVEAEAIVEDGVVVVPAARGVLVEGGRHGCVVRLQARSDPVPTRLRRRAGVG